MPACPLHPADHESHLSLSLILLALIKHFTLLLSFILSFIPAMSCFFSLIVSYFLAITVMPAEIYRSLLILKQIN